MKTSLIPEAVTSTRAFWKSALFTTSLSSVSGGTFSSSRFSSGSSLRRHFMAASLQRYSRSAPTYPWLTEATFSRLTHSGALLSISSGMLRVCIDRMSLRPFLSGTRISISRSNLPGRRSAGSMALGRLVADITMTLPRASSPSMSESICETTRLSTSPVTSSRLALSSLSRRRILSTAPSRAPP